MMRPAAIGLSAILTSGCAVSTEPHQPISSPRTIETPDGFEPSTAVYRCETGEGEIRLVTRTRPNGLHVFLPPEMNQAYLNCEHDRRASIWEHAKLSGVDFRAVGNEPGWVLEIREGNRLSLSYDYGQSNLEADISVSRSDAATRSTRYVGYAGERRIEVLLVGESCPDTMVDETYPTRVEVTFDDRRLTGCGRPLH